MSPINFISFSVFRFCISYSWPLQAGLMKLDLYLKPSGWLSKRRLCSEQCECLRERRCTCFPSATIVSSSLMQYRAQHLSPLCHQTALYGDRQPCATQPIPAHLRGDVFFITYIFITLLLSYSFHVHSTYLLVWVLWGWKKMFAWSLRQSIFKRIFWALLL